MLHDFLIDIYYTLLNCQEKNIYKEIKFLKILIPINNFDFFMFKNLLLFRM